MNTEEYDQYVYFQTVKYMSHEEEQSVWATGQIRFIESISHLISNSSKILDVGCGDGISLEILTNLGHNVVGVDLNEEKLSRAVSRGFTTVRADMHDLSFFLNNEFDVLISSHSLEHAYDPRIVLDEFNRILNNNGLLFIVLPFPDVADYSIEAHVGRDILGTSDPIDGHIKLVNLMNDHGFSVSKIIYDDYREPEIWIYCRKK